MEKVGKVVDVFTYNGEKDILEIHLNILAPFVDQFIIVESKTTFSGNKKPLYFSQHQHLFRKFYKKLTYFIIDEEYSDEERELARNSPNTKGASHWENEFLQKESMKKALTHLQDDDIVLVGDVDEIIDPIITHESKTPIKAKLRVYTYYLNNESSEQFYGTLIAEYKDIKGKVLNHIRSDKSLHSKGDYLGWHFTSMGGIKEVQRKLNDSYTTESYNTYKVQENLPHNIKERKDFLGRNFTYTIDESHWPRYLKEHKDEYKHLLWQA